MVIVTKFYTCPYCTEWFGEHAKKVPKTIGKYRIKEIDGSNVLILQCQKCLKTFRIIIVGSPILWADMTKQEQTAFKYKLRSKGE